ncbi:MAG: hypothetical protein HOO96_35960 [Polyangiaceae bacterium]|nr:hypothetical protein [Polyangiaceae bacterium]
MSDDAPDIEAEWSADAAALWDRGEEAYYAPRTDEVVDARVTYETARQVRIARGRWLMSWENKLVKLAKKVRMYRDDFAQACEDEREAATYVHPVAVLPEFGELEASE